MGFEILIDTQAAEDRITGMLGKLQKVPVPAEFTEWQKQDMKRKYPTTEEINPTTAATTIYPRSPVKVRKRRVRPLLRGKATRIAKPPTGNKRPILRPGLFEKLCQRMKAMMERELKW